MRPLLTRDSRWPERPTRWSAAATVRGDWTCTTRSIAPTSMPSSSDDVATSARSLPSLRRFSASRRARRDSEPWCAATRPSPTRSFRSRASRSAGRRLWANTSVVRWAATSSAICWSAASQIVSLCAVRKSSTGVTTRTSSCRAKPASTTAGSRAVVPLRNASASSTGLTVAEHPIRRGRGGADAVERLAQVLLDVVVEGPERRDVDDVDAVFQSTIGGEAVQVIERPEERGQRLPGAGGRDDQRVATGRDGVPALALGAGGLGKCCIEPASDERQKRRHRLIVRAGDFLTTCRRESEEPPTDQQNENGDRGDVSLLQCVPRPLRTSRSSAAVELFVSEDVEKPTVKPKVNCQSGTPLVNPRRTPASNHAVFAGQGCQLTPRSAESRWSSRRGFSPFTSPDRKSTRLNSSH